MYLDHAPGSHPSNPRDAQGCNHHGAGECGPAGGGHYVPWPEHAMPEGVELDCGSFGLAGHGRLVWGEGNPNASLMLVLDNPGAREDRHGVPFVCGTRQTLQAAAHEAGLDLNALYVTYLVKCRALRAYDKPKARRIGLRYLQQQLATMK